MPLKTVTSGWFSGSTVSNPAEFGSFRQLQERVGWLHCEPWRRSGDVQPAVAAARAKPGHHRRPGPGRAPAQPAGGRSAAARADPHPGGDGNWEGAPGRDPPPGGPAGRRAVRRRQLRGHPRDPARGGAVRVRAWSVHRRAPREGRATPDGAPGDALPRRGRSPAGGIAGEAAQGPRGAIGAALGEHAQRARRRVDRRGDERGPPGSDASAPLPRGPLSPAGGLDASLAGAPGAGRGHRPTRRALPGAGVCGLRTGQTDAGARRARGDPRLRVAGERAGAGQRDGAGGVAHRRERRSGGGAGAPEPSPCRRGVFLAAAWRTGLERRRRAAGSPRQRGAS